MGLYERLLEERKKEERRRGRPLGMLYGSDFQSSTGYLPTPPKHRPPRYAADLATMRRLITSGPRSPGAGMRLGSLRRRYPEKYALLRAWRDGGLFEQPEVPE